MMHVLKNWAILSGAVLVTSVVLAPVMKMKSWKTAVWVAAVFGVLQSFFLKFLIFLSWPAWVLTFGLLTFVLQAFLLWITDKAIDDMHIKSFGWTLVAALLITVGDRVGHFLLR